MEKNNEFFTRFCNVVENRFLDCREQFRADLSPSHNAPHLFYDSTRCHGVAVSAAAATWLQVTLIHVTNLLHSRIISR